MRKKLLALALSAIMLLSVIVVPVTAQAFDPFGPDWEPWDERYILINEYFPPVDLGGATIIINALHPEDTEDEFLREQFMNNWAFVEQKYNITLDFIYFGTGGGSGIEWADVPDAVIASVAAGDPIVHVFRATNGATWFPALARSGILLPDDGWIYETFPENWWRFVGEYGGRIYGVESNFPFAANRSLVYNRDMILRSGMDMTPSEMFMAGNWSHEDFFEYMSELLTLLPDGVVPLHAAFSNIYLGLVHANAGHLRNPETGLPTYIDEPSLEVVRFMQRLINAGLMSAPGFNPATEDWVQGAPYFLPNVPLFQEEGSAMTTLERWQFGGTSAHVEFGIVPFPWGPEVEWPESGDWRDLADYGYTSPMNDANLLTVVRGGPEGLTHAVAMGIAHSLFVGAAARPGELAIDGMRAHAAGDPNPVPAPNLAQLFEFSDMELWQWYADLATLVRPNTPAAVLGAGGLLRSLGENIDVTPLFRGLLGEDIWNMYDMGRIARDDIPEDMWLLAVEFNVAAMEAAAAQEDALEAFVLALYALLEAINNADVLYICEDCNMPVDGDDGIHDALNLLDEALGILEGLGVPVNLCETCGMPFEEEYEDE